MIDTEKKPTKSGPGKKIIKIESIEEKITFITHMLHKLKDIHNN